MTVHLETARLILRAIRPTDQEGMYLLDSDPEVHTYLGKQPISSRAEAAKVIAYIENQYQQNGIGRLAVIEKRSGNFIGWSGLKYESGVRKDFSYYDLGYRFIKQYWGQGFATEAALASLEYGFKQLELTTICAGADINNYGSNNVLQKVGMQLIEVFDYDGIPHNWYELKREDWLAGPI